MPSSKQHLRIGVKQCFLASSKSALHNGAMSTELWQRLRAARKHANLTQQAVADACGISREAVSQWEAIDVAKRSRPETGNLQTVSRITGAPLDWLLADSADMSPEAWLDAPTELVTTSRVSTRETPSSHVRFPLLDGFAGMGRGDYVGDYPEIVDFVEVTREWATQKLRSVPADKIRVITGRGDSMRGQYSDGDLVFVDARIKQFMGDSAYCFRWHGQVQIKRLQLVGRNIVRILSANAAYPPIDVPIDDIEIGGRALAAWTLTEF